MNNQINIPVTQVAHTLNRVNSKSNQPLREAIANTAMAVTESTIVVRNLLVLANIMLAKEIDTEVDSASLSRIPANTEGTNPYGGEIPNVFKTSG